MLECRYGKRKSLFCSTIQNKNKEEIHNYETLETVEFENCAPVSTSCRGSRWSRLWWKGFVVNVSFDPEWNNVMDGESGEKVEDELQSVTSAGE